MKKIILSDHKLNLLVDDVTTRLRESRPLQGGHIGGTEILDFCPHKQVGQFVRFRIYQDATQFVSQLNHPSFDFSAQEMKEELRNFLGTLSRNIRLNERDFQTLLQQAVYNTIKLILNPEDSITNFFFGNAEVIPLELYRKHAPYFTDYDFVIRAILAWHEKQQLTRVERDVFLEKFERVVELYEKKEGKSLGEYQRGLFRSLTGVEMDTVVANAPSQVIRTETAGAAIEFPREEKRNPETPRVERHPQDAPGAEGSKKPLISIRPKDKEATPPVQQPAQEPFVPREEKRTVPPWVEQKTPPPPPAEEKAKTVFSVNSTPPRSETPPWVEKKVEHKAEGIVLDPIVPLDEPEEEIIAPKPQVQVETPKLEVPNVIASIPVVEQPKLEAPAFVPPVLESKVEEVKAPVAQVLETPAAELPETRSNLLSPENKEERRSLNDRFNTKANERSSILERSIDNSNASEEKGGGSILDRFKANKDLENKAPIVPPVTVPEPIAPVLETPKVEMPKVEPVTPPETLVEKPLIEQQPASKTLNSQTPETRTLADRFKDQPSTNSVADNIATKNIRTEQIPVHKQFQFVQKVFGGSSVKFKVILDKINKTTSMAEAEDVLEKYVFNDPTVNRNDKVAKEFEQLVRAKFE